MDAFLSFDLLSTLEDVEIANYPTSSPPSSEGLPLSFEHDPGGSGHFYCVIA
ncbi:hypothetical protein TRAPUB_9009 [Trametes pubescens]|uniref:Pheromone n=1 Tax=Trametes pubescens TaxID=154538 RepID=A0A1M2W3K9_TRAPU|nr:hypothetical protein TRAPUB_9009 [Trametes pubescens]